MKKFKDLAKKTPNEQNEIEEVKVPANYAQMMAKKKKKKVSQMTPAEIKKREEIAKAIEKDSPGMPMAKKMAIATATAKRVAEAKKMEDDPCWKDHEMVGTKVKNGKTVPNCVPSESTAEYGKSQAAIARKRQLAAMKPGEMDKLKRLKDMLKNANKKESVEEALSPSYQNKYIGRDKASLTKSRNAQLAQIDDLVKFKNKNMRDPEVIHHQEILKQIDFAMRNVKESIEAVDKYTSFSTQNKGRKPSLRQNKLSSAEYQKAKTLKAFNKDDWKWNGDQQLYVRIQESAEPVLELTAKQKADIAKRKEINLVKRGKKAPEPKKKSEFRPSSTVGNVKSEDDSIIMQLRKAQDVNGKFDIRFHMGKKGTASKADLDTVLKFYDSISKPVDKRKVQIHLSKGGPAAVADLAKQLRSAGR